MGHILYKMYSGGNKDEVHGSESQEMSGWRGLRWRDAPTASVPKSVFVDFACPVKAEWCGVVGASKFGAACKLLSP
jgi:hypothetical protein